MKGTPIIQARNLGPKSAAEFEAVGITTLEQLREVGWEQAMLLLIEANPARVNLNAAVAVIGAIEDCHWQDVPSSLKVEAKRFLKTIDPKRT